MAFKTRELSLDRFVAEVDLIEPDLPVAVATIDLDDFAAVNDNEGEKAGDAVLSRFERSLRRALPSGALIGHVRGDEFVVALPDTSAEEALLALDGARRAAAPVHASIGIAARPAHGSTAEELLEAADAALVRAKQSGGGKVAIHVEERMVLKSSYYPRAALHRLAKLSRRSGRTEASLLRQALDELLDQHQAAV
jgi:diguanylate cyclase (GGDEF)-like protein